MNYTLLFHQSPDEFAARTDPKRSEAFFRSFSPYLQAIKDAGIYVNGAGLVPPESTTTVRLRDGQRIVQDGPFADTKEQIGGFITLEVPDLDAALAWAARFPMGPEGGVEVRPSFVTEG
jgi:hypothetical protein